MALYEVSTIIPRGYERQAPKGNIQLKILREPCSPEYIVESLSRVIGPLDVYFWYEGPNTLPKSGAQFMKERLYKPLNRLKPDAKLFLYSLRAWRFDLDVDQMPSTTPIGEAINRINRTFVECIDASSFFKYCRQVPKESSLYGFINEELPKKRGLFELSSCFRRRNKTVGALFNEQASLFDCIKDRDLALAYSALQYIEGYYLIREIVEKRLSLRQKKIEIAFALPNDESKYYLDLPNDIEKMLRLDFGEKLSEVSVNISFFSFQYGKGLKERPYKDEEPEEMDDEVYYSRLYTTYFRRKEVVSDQIGAYFDYLSQ